MKAPGLYRTRHDARTLCQRVEAIAYHDQGQACSTTWTCSTTASGGTRRSYEAYAPTLVKLSQETRDAEERLLKGVTTHGQWFWVGASHS